VFAAEFLCALDVFARHTSSRVTFLTLTIVGRSRGDVSSHPDVFQTFGLLETMYDVQKHPMHTKIQQQTHRRKIHFILQCQLQDRKYYLPPGMCNLWSSIHQATDAMQIANLTFHFENGIIPKLIQNNGPPQSGIYTLGQ
jgi:hypothetical protein